MLILTGAYIYIYIYVHEREREISVDHSWIRLLVSRGLLRPVCDAAKTCVTPANSPPVTNYRPHFSTTFFHKRIIRTTLIDHPSGGPLWKRIPPYRERENLSGGRLFRIGKIGKEWNYFFYLEREELRGERDGLSSFVWRNWRNAQWRRNTAHKAHPRGGRSHTP